MMNLLSKPKTIGKLQATLTDSQSTGGSIYLCLILFIMFLGGIMATDLYLPSLPHIAKYFHTASSNIKITISIYIAGYAISQLIYGPLSDYIGRYPTVLIGMLLFVLGSLGCSLSDSAHTLITMRLLQGLGGGAGMCMARSIVRDVYEGNRLAQVASYMSIALGILPAFAPLIGGYIQFYFNWKTVFLAMTVVSLISLTLVSLLLPETNRHRGIRPFNLSNIFSSYRAILTNHFFISNTILAGVVMAGLFVYYTLSPFILQNLLHVSVTQYSWLFLINAGAVFAGQLLNTILVRRLKIKRTMFTGVILLVTGSCLLLAPAVLHCINKTMIILPMAIFSVGAGLVMSNAMVNALQGFKETVGSASSIFSSLQMLITGSATYIAAKLPGHSQLGFATLMLALAIVALVFLAATYLANPGSPRLFIKYNKLCNDPRLKSKLTPK